MAATTVSAATISSFILLFLLSYAPAATYSAAFYKGSVPPNFTASNFLFIDQSGDFLASLNGNYTAAVANNEPESPSFYLLVYHTASHTTVWAANRNSPISNSGQIRLSSTGITIHTASGEQVWSTPPINSTVGSLQLRDSGNLVLLDRLNNTLWQSFDYPTDTVVPGQRFLVGRSLIAANSQSDLSEADYAFAVTSGDGELRWRNSTYYKLSMNTKSIWNSNHPISYLVMNQSGLYMLGNDGLDVVIQVLLPPADGNSYRILKMTNDGYLNVMRYADKNWATDFTAPADGCQVPFRCGQIGLCSAGVCSCPPGFHGDPNRNPGCSPSDTSLSLPESCGSNRTQSQSNSSENLTYIRLRDGMKYISIDFSSPARNYIDLSTCQNLCSANCSCLAIFYVNSSGNCYLLENNLGSIVSTSGNGGNDGVGYIKAIDSSPSSANLDGNSKSNFPVAGLVLLPATGVLLVLIGIVLFEKRRRGKTGKAKKPVNNIPSSEELEVFSIAGLPVRFDYEELVTATENFGNQIGSGGFGIVYKGTLNDKTVVAVKKITGLGSQRKKEFCTEIAVIGNIHHVNLVRLKGFCAQGRERFLVYEYMSRGSLDKTLFGNGPPLEWQERFDIALGTARGLAYLHHGCDHKIIHCDVKPENILLSENMQVKISDFGLSKLLSPEQSGLFTTMRGTRGYLAPEWLTNTAISDKTDVYSYGMVLLELIRGRKNCFVRTSSHGSGDSSSHGLSSSSSGSNRPTLRPLYFPLYALEMHEEGRYLELVEPRLLGRVTREEAEKLVKVALCCLHEDPMLRPTMTNVVGMLEGVLPVGEPRVEYLNFLRFYGRRFTEPSTVATGAEVEQSGFVLGAIDSSSPSASPNSFSYLSSQQVSGPR